MMKGYIGPPDDKDWIVPTGELIIDEGPRMKKEPWKVNFIPPTEPYPQGENDEKIS